MILQLQPRFLSERLPAERKTAGRAAVTVSAAQAAAMDNIGTSTSVVATITSVGQPTAGLVRVTLQYAIVQ